MLLSARSQSLVRAKMMNDPSSPQSEPTLDYARPRAPHRLTVILDAFLRWFTGPPRTWQVVALAVISGLYIYASSIPSGRAQFLLNGSMPCLLLGACFLWPGGLLLLGGDFLLRMIVTVASGRLSALDVRWYISGLLFAAVLITWQTDWPLHLRFEANRSALEACVAELLEAAGGSPPADKRDPAWPVTAFEWYEKDVGGYHVMRVAVFPDHHVVYLTTGGFFKAEWGFVFDPARRDGGPLPKIISLGNGWYTFGIAD